MDAGSNHHATTSGGIRMSMEEASVPERIFSSASLWSTALNNRYSVWMVELMVFLKRNKAFLPTTTEVVAEVARRKKAKRAAKAPPPRPPRPPRPPLLLLAGGLFVGGLGG